MEDERLAKILQEKAEAIQKSDNTYNALLQDNQDLYNKQNEYANQYEQGQNEILDKQLAFREQQIEQQKEIARQNKETEEKKAKNDYTAFINPYGYQAESLAGNGLLNSGLAETTKLGGFNTYQNRLASANKAMQDAIVQYDNDINEARLNNDVQKAQNALTKLQLQLDFAQSFYSNKSTLQQNQLSNNQNLDNNYYNRYQTEYSNIQAEKERAEKIRQWEAEMAEQIRQYNENLAFQKAKEAQSQANWEKEYALANSARSSSSSSSSRSSSSGGGTTLTNSTSLNGSNSQSTQSKYTNPYTGTINPDCKNGTFSNNYQPNNIGGKKLTDSKLTVAGFIGQKGSTNSGGKNIDNQTVWKLGDRYYAWDGYANQYVDITDSKSKNIGKTKSILQTTMETEYKAKNGGYF